MLSALWRILSKAANQSAATLVLVDVRPSLGAFNRSVLVAEDHVVVPLAPDLYSLTVLRNLGPTLHSWQEEWSERRPRNSAKELVIPTGLMSPIGYVPIQHAVRLDRPVKAYARWMDRIPIVYAQDVKNEDYPDSITID